ncbi:MAG: ASKHA domain-containing protein, partial [Desulfuromonadaceae bacterium]
VGTNGEMALYASGRGWVTSVPAGPAFEGGEIGCGMAALPGAVRHVTVHEDSWELETVDDLAPCGVCGSGLVAIIAAALDGGLIDRQGTIVTADRIQTNLSRYIVATADGPALRLYRDARIDLLLTQQDIRQFQLAKGAVRAGVECLLQRAGVLADQVEEVVLTGAFGFSLLPNVLKRVAILPETVVEKVRFMPAGALAGVIRFLREPRAVGVLDALTGTLRPYPLSGTPAFEKAFLRALDF